MSERVEPIPNRRSSGTARWHTVPRPVHAAILLVGLCGLVGPGCEKQTQQAGRPASGREEPAWFEEDALASNLDFKYIAAVVQRFYYPEIFSGGVGLLDYDGDGFLDVYLVQGGDLVESLANRPGNRLYRNRRDGTFEDVTEATGTGDAGYGMGCACADYDHDGDVDLYVTNVGRNVLYRNNGDGTFTDVTKQAGVGDPGWSTSAAFADLDGDGHLDLFVVNYIEWSPTRELKCLTVRDQRDYCHPNGYNAPAPDTLFLGDGRGGFVDVTAEAGVRGSFGNGLGVATGDFNADGREDIYVANDAMPNRLWINQGGHRFVDDALMMGCAMNRFGAAEAGMGVATVDIDQDGDSDLFMSHLTSETNTVYINEGKWFDDATAALGLGVASIPFNGFGLGFADFNLDGRLDVFVANGRVSLFEPIPDRSKPYAEHNLLFRGRLDGRFEEVFPRGGTSELLTESSRGAAFGDLDNDGDIDIVIGNNAARVHLLRNVHQSAGHWAMFRVLNRGGSYALGASVRIDAGGVRRWRRVQRAYSFCSSNDPRVHVGLGPTDRIDEVVVHWPGRGEESFGPFGAGLIYELREGTGRNR